MKKIEKKIKIWLSWIILLIGSLFYFGLIQVLAKLTSGQFALILIMMGLWGLIYNAVWRYVKEINK